MTATILPPRELAVLRGIAKSAAVLIALLMIERIQASRATTENELAHILQVDVRTVHKQCLYLSASGLVSGQGADRWMLTPAGRGTLFAPSDDVRSIEESAPLLSAGFAVSAQNVLHDMNDDDAKNVLIIDSSSSSIIDGTKCEKTKQILLATDLLFGSAVYLHTAILERDPDFALGWVAKAYADKDRLRNPLGLLYKRLMDLTGLPVMYQKNPARGLPAEYLRAIGMDDVIEKQELDEEIAPATYELPVYEHEEVGRNCDWRSIVNGLPEIKGASFHGAERVCVDGYVMTVFLRQIGRDNRAQFANEHVAPVASRIYAEQSGMSTARVEFVLEEV